MSENSSAAKPTNTEHVAQVAYGEALINVNDPVTALDVNEQLINN